LNLSSRNHWVSHLRCKHLADRDEGGKHQHDSRTDRDSTHPDGPEVQWKPIARAAPLIRQAPSQLQIEIRGRLDHAQAAHHLSQFGLLLLKVLTVRAALQMLHRCRTKLRS